jgi:hypothetical protein
MKRLTEQELRNTDRDRDLPAISSLQLASILEYRHSEVLNTARRIIAQERLDLSDYTYLFITRDEVESSALIFSSRIAKMIACRLLVESPQRSKVIATLEERENQFLLTLKKSELIALIQNHCFSLT